jgi:hypothetical protein
MKHDPDDDLFKEHGIKTPAPRRKQPKRARLKTKFYMSSCEWTDRAAVACGRRLSGNEWRRDGCCALSMQNTRTSISVVSLKRSAQNRIGTLTFGRAWPGKLEFPTSGATRRTPRRIAKRRTKRPLEALGRPFLSEVQVPILRLLQGRVFEPEVVNAMVTAFEDVLCELKLTDRGDPIVERVAKISH